MLRILIIDSDQRFINRLIKNLVSFTLGLVEIEHTVNPPHALAQFFHFKPDIIFLDAAMAEDMDFASINVYSQRISNIVFTSTQMEYAVQAVRAKAFDFLLSPVNPQQLESCLKRYLLAKNQYDLVDTAKIGRLFRPNRTVRIANSVLNHHEIICLVADGNYTWIQFVGKQPALMSRTLSHFEWMLRGAGFIRTHKSYLVNLLHIKSFDQKFECLTLSDGSEARISRRRKPEVWEVINARVPPDGRNN